MPTTSTDRHLSTARIALIKALHYQRFFSSIHSSTVTAYARKAGMYARFSGVTRQTWLAMLPASCEVEQIWQPFVEELERAAD